MKSKSIKKYTNVEVCEIHARLMERLGYNSKTALAKELGVSLQNLKNREDRGVNKLDDVELLCSREGINKNWAFTGKGTAVGIDQDAQNVTNGGNIHIDVHHPPPSTTQERYEQYADPVAQAFLKDWYQLSDPVKMRVWTLVKEELEKAKNREAI